MEIPGSIFFCVKCTNVYRIILLENTGRDCDSVGCVIVYIKKLPPCRYDLCYGDSIEWGN